MLRADGGQIIIAVAVGLALLVWPARDIERRLLVRPRGPLLGFVNFSARACGAHELHAERLHGFIRPFYGTNR